MIKDDELRFAIDAAVKMGADSYRDAKNDAVRQRALSAVTFLELARVSCNMNQDEHGYALLCFASGMLFDDEEFKREQFPWLDVVQPDRLRKAV